MTGGLREVLSWILPESTSGRLIVWLAMAAGWVLAAASLVSFNAADWPSHVVAVHNDPTRNLVGGLGAWAAYWAYAILGLGAWIPLLFAGVALGLVAAGRDVTHPFIRSLGVGLMMLAIAGLHAHWFPSLGVLTGADAGMLPQWIADQFFPRFGGFGTSVVLLLTLAIGALVAMDEVVFALPGALTRTFSFLEPLFSHDWARSLGKLRSARTATPVPAGAAVTADEWEGATVIDDRRRPAAEEEGVEEEEEAEEDTDEDAEESAEDDSEEVESDEDDEEDDETDDSEVSVIDEDEHDEEELEEKAYAAWEKQQKAEEARKAKAEAKAAAQAAKDAAKQAAAPVAATPEPAATEAKQARVRPRLDPEVAEPRRLPKLPRDRVLAAAGPEQEDVDPVGNLHAGLRPTAARTRGRAPRRPPGWSACRGWC